MSEVTKQDSPFARPSCPLAALPVVRSTKVGDLNTTIGRDAFCRHANVAGWYTELGDVLDLVRAADNATVVFGSGEEIAFEFEKCLLAAWEIVSVSCCVPVDGAKTWTSSPRTASNCCQARRGHWTNWVDLLSLTVGPVGRAVSNFCSSKLELFGQRPDLG